MVLFPEHVANLTRVAEQFTKTEEQTQSKSSIDEKQSSQGQETGDLKDDKSTEVNSKEESQNPPGSKDAHQSIEEPEELTQRADKDEL